MKATIMAKHGLQTLNLSRRRAVREKCLNCSGWVNSEVKNCKFKECPLYPFRMISLKQNAKARNKALRSYCIWCMAGLVHEVKKCVSVHCPFFNFRIGATRKMTLDVEKLAQAAISDIELLGLRVG